MYGKYPRSVHVAFHNPLPGKDEEFNYWYNFIHIPDVLDLGLFDRVYRYEVIGEGQARYMAILESDYVDLNDELASIEPASEELRASGRIWPVFEKVWNQSLFGVGIAHPFNNRDVTFLSVVQSNCGNPGREDEFNKWYNELHLPEYLETGFVHTAYRYQRYEPLPKGDGRFLAFYESDVPLQDREAGLNKILANSTALWYDLLPQIEGQGPRLAVKRQEETGFPRPDGLILEGVSGVASGSWRPIGSSE